MSHIKKKKIGRSQLNTNKITKTNIVVVQKMTKCEK